MKHALVLLLSLYVAVSCYAKDFETKTVLLQGLDKTTGRTSFLTLNVGEPYKYGDLVVLAEKCMKRPPEETPENSAYLTIHEGDDKEVFKGWMFSSNPALSAMEHSVYDIWVVECKDDQASVTVPVQVLISDETADDEVDTDNLED